MSQRTYLVQFQRHFFFFFNDTATTEIYTLSLHDALPIFARAACCSECPRPARTHRTGTTRSEEHTSELQSRFDLVCRLLLEKKKKKSKTKWINSYKYYTPTDIEARHI